MELVILYVIVIVFLFIQNHFSSNKRKRKILSRVREAWGKTPDNEFDDRDFDRFASFFNEYGKKNARFVMDDITWNDLEMDKLYARMNSTHTSTGDQLLYSILRTPIYDEAVMEKRKRLIDFWSINQNDRERVQVELGRFGKYNDKGASVLLGQSDYLDLNDNKSFKIFTFLPLASALFIFINIGLGVLLVILSIAFNIFYHERLYKEMELKISAASSATAIIALAGRLVKLNPEGITEQTDLINNCYTRLKGALRKFSPSMFLLRSGDPMQDMADIPKMIFMTDIWSFDASIRFLREKKEYLARMIEAIGIWDATISIASFRESLKEWCVPEIVWNSTSENDLYINAENVKHPMIKDCIGNPIHVKKPVLLTGSNASGKSTYLKIVVMNTILAHSIMTCFAESWVSVPLFPITSIALRDNVINGESYFVAEIKSMRRIFQSVNNEVRCLCIIDEVLRGTNTIERIAASSRIISALAALNTCVFAATHDVELTGILKDKFENKHFEETITNEDIRFDYLLKEGRATSRNAIKLLELMKFDTELIQNCNEVVNDFEKTGRWEAI